MLQDTGRQKGQVTLRFVLAQFLAGTRKPGIYSVPPVESAMCVFLPVAFPNAPGRLQLSAQPSCYPAFRTRKLCRRQCTHVPEVSETSLRPAPAVLARIGSLLFRICVGIASPATSPPHLQRCVTSAFNLFDTSGLSLPTRIVLVSSAPGGHALRAPVASLSVANTSVCGNNLSDR